MFYIKFGQHSDGEKQLYMIASSHLGNTSEFRQKLMDLCKSTCPAKAEAVYRALTDKYTTVVGVAMDHYMSERSLLDGIHAVLRRYGSFDGWRIVSGDDYRLIARIRSSPPEAVVKIEEILSGKKQN